MAKTEQNKKKHDKILKAGVRRIDGMIIERRFIGVKDGIRHYKDFLAGTY